MKIANVVSKGSVRVPGDFNVVESVNDIIQNIPTLIVGWDFIKVNYPNADMLHRKLSPNLYWTFKKTEKRDLHDEDVYNFIQNSYNTLVSDVKYIFIDPFSHNRRLIKIAIKIYSSEIISYRHVNPHKRLDMVYLYTPNIIFGIDLNLMEYAGMDIEKMITKIKTNSKVFLDSNSIFIEYKDGIENLDGQVKYIPLLYSIRHG